ncbi:MAG TPA: hypothetical protein VGR73_04180 [Bryobacteraceae bacterium]|nr:hypothetical protein [Bryobacteraceae bacterium]
MPLILRLAPLPIFAAAVLFSEALLADDPAFERVSMKLALLSSRQAEPGSVILFSPDEVDAWVRTRVPARFPGIRAPKLVLGTGNVTGSARIDFNQVLAAEGQPLNPALERLFEGEHPVRIVARIESSGGQAVVSPTRVEVSGIAATGPMLDLLVKTFLLPLFPDAKIGQPFEWDFGIDRVDVRPDGVRVAIKKR